MDGGAEGGVLGLSLGSRDLFWQPKNSICRMNNTFPEHNVLPGVLCVLNLVRVYGQRIATLLTSRNRVSASLLADRKNWPLLGKKLMVSWR